MKTAIRILVDNYAGAGLAAEHGLSLWIEAGSCAILFDTGQGGALTPNAEKLGLNLSETDVLVLSHGHYDHTGGVSTISRVAPGMEVYCHPHAVVPRYGVRGGEAKPLGMPCEAKRGFDRLPAQKIHWVTEGKNLSPKMGITGYIPRETGYEDTGGSFFLDPGLQRVDSVDDDLALWINTPEGVIACVGCCHAGLVNTLNRILMQSGASRLRAVIGGFHLLNADDARLEKTINALRPVLPDLIVPCHCTGTRAVEALKGAFGDRVTPGFSGGSFEF